MGLDPLVNQRPLNIIFHLFPVDATEGESLSLGSSPMLLLLYYFLLKFLLIPLFILFFYGSSYRVFGYMATLKCVLCTHGFIHLKL